MSEDPKRPAGGRRALEEPPMTGRRVAGEETGRRLGLPVALAVALPLLTAGALALVGDSEAPAEPATPPTRTELSLATGVCPTAAAGAPQVYAGTIGDRPGTLGVGSEETEVRPGRLSAVRSPGATVVTAREAMAPLFLAGRAGGADDLAAVGCSGPVAERWFTGVGGGATHSSVLELTNPDRGAAVADITVLTSTGVRPVSDVRGITVGGGSTKRIDLSKVAPDENELAIRVVVPRGRLGSAMVDRSGAVTAQATTEWLPGQTSPARRQVVLGSPNGEATRQLVLANPGRSEARVDVQLIDKSSTYAPLGLDQVRLEPQTVTTVDVGKVLDKALGSSAAGLSVESSSPVTATLRTSGDDESVQPVDEAFATGVAVLPEGEAKLDLTAPASCSENGKQGCVASVQAFNGKGEAALDRKVTLAGGTLQRLDLPQGSRYVVVRADGTQLHGAAVVTSTAGVATVPLQPNVGTALVPSVRPAGVQSGVLAE